MIDEPPPPVQSGPIQPGPGQRVRITNPRTTGRPLLPRTVVQEIDEDTAIGEVYMRSLMRSQLRLAISAVVVLAASVASLPLVFVGMPGINDVRVVGIPLPWLLLGFVVYPVIFVVGYVYVRHSERAERTFAELVERP